ncbi:MAG TPA: hypothetical protein VGP26_27475 [Actinophytocola sp.]|nr:hypothetical protein [Actinophytocola sp.]
MAASHWSRGNSDGSGLPGWNDHRRPDSVAGPGGAACGDAPAVATRVGVPWLVGRYPVDWSELTSMT